MAKKTLNEAIVAELATEGVIEVEGGKFNKAVRSMDINDPLTEGDEISIPADYKVLGTQINGAVDEAGKPVITPYIMVEVSNPETGKEQNMRFFPNQLAKIVFPVDENGKRLPKVKTTGSAAKKFAEFQQVDEAMEFLKGKKIKVVKDNLYQTERYNDHAIVNTHIYQYDLMA